MKEINIQNYVLNARLLPSEIDEVRINCICCSWRRTNIDTEMQTIPPQILATWFRKILLNFAGIKWRMSRYELIYKMLDCFHQKLLKLELIVFVAVWRRMNVDTQKFIRFPPIVATWFRKMLLNFAGIKWRKSRD